MGRGRRRLLGAALILAGLALIVLVWWLLRPEGGGTPPPADDVPTAAVPSSPHDTAAGDRPAKRARAQEPGAAPAGPAEQPEEQPEAGLDESYSGQLLEVLVRDPFSPPLAGVEVRLVDVVPDIPSPVATTGEDGIARLAVDRVQWGRPVATSATQIGFGRYRHFGVGRRFRETVFVTKPVSLTGRIVDSVGRGVPKASVTVTVAELSAQPYWERTSTDEGGAFALRPIPYQALADGGCAIRVESRPFLPKTVRLGPDLPPEGGLVIELDEGVTVRGRCLDEEGRPVAAFVRAEGTRSWHFTQGEGRFSFRPAPSDTRALVVRPNEHVAVRVTGLRAVGGNVLDAGDVIVRRGGKASGVAYTSAGRTWGFGGGIVVYDSRFGEKVSTAPVDEAGRFMVWKLGEGPYRLTLEGPAENADGWPEFGFLDGVRAGDEGLQLITRPARALRVNLLRAEDGEPLETYKVWLAAALTTNRRVTVSKTVSGGVPGRITVQLEPGTWDVIVEVPDREPVVFRGVEITDTDVVTREARFRTR